MTSQRIGLISSAVPLIFGGGVMLGEVLTAWRIGGIALVFLGILTIARS